MEGEAINIGGILELLRPHLPLRPVPPSHVGEGSNPHAAHRAHKAYKPWSFQQATADQLKGYRRNPQNSSMVVFIADTRPLKKTGTGVPREGSKTT